MAYKTTYTGDGSTTAFTIPFGYIDSSHLVVTVGGVTKTLNTDFTLTSASTLTFNTAPANAAEIKIERVTATNALVTYQQGALISADDLNTTNTQAVYVSEEAKGVSTEAKTSAEASAATVSTNIVAIQAASGNAAAAAASETAAAASETAAAASETAAATSATNAAASATSASTDKTAAEVAKNLAEAAKTSAFDAVSFANTHKNNAATSATNAATSETNAASSATAAATSATAAAASAASINNYSLPTASSSTLGGIKIGSGLSIDGSGVVTASGGGGSSLTVQDEGSALSTDATTLNFVGNGVTASGTGATKTITVTDTNTTYSVGDGGLTEKNFTTALNTKLSGIEANATADQTASEIKTAYESNSDTNAFTDAEKTKLSGIATSANNYVHPNHSGEVTSTADGATVIADGVVDEANLKVSNSPTDGYVLTARSGNTGGLTWEAASGGGSGMPTTGGTFTGDVTFEGAQYTNRNVVWDKSDSALEFADNAKIRLGQQSDLQIYHNAQDSYISANISGNLYLRNATDDYDVVIQSDSGAGGIADYFRADGSTGEAKLFHYGNEKLKTQSGGVDITGDITVSGSVDGRDIATNIPSSLGTAGQVLTVNSGASAAEWADASGGGSGISNLVEDTTPQLGGDLDTNSKSIKFGDRSSSGVNELVFGDGDDLRIFHGTNNHSQIVEGGSGNLQIYASNLQLKSNAGADYIVATDGGAVELYHNSNKKAETTSSGLQTTGTLNVNGAYTLPTADGSANQVLTTNGSGVASWAAASGGGGSPDLFDENYDGSSSAPSASGSNSVSIGVGASSGAANAFSAGLNAYAGGMNSTALGRNAVASGEESASFGGWAKTPTYSTGAVALGKSYASGTYSLAASIANNSSSYGASAMQSVSIGYNTKATGGNSVAIGLLSNSSASNALSMMRGAASSSKAIAIGYESVSSANNAVSLGEWAKADIKGKFAYSNGQTWSVGNAQTGVFVLKSDTTDATAEALTTNNSTASTDNQVVLPNNSAYAFSGTIVARQKASEGTASAAWKVEGLIRREGSAGTTVLVNSAITVLDNTPNWGMALSADTTNGCLKVAVTGAASTNIRWVGTIHTSEVTYA